MADSGTKYAALLFSGPVGSEKSILRLAPDIITWDGKLSDHVADKDIHGWKAWLGSMAWDQLMGEQRIILCAVPSATPDAFDDESQSLERRLNVARYAYVFAAPSTGYDSAFRCIGGRAASIEPTVRLDSIQHHGHFRSIERPLYRSRPAFIDVWPWRDEDPWLDRWVEWMRVIDAAGPPFPVLLDVATTAFDAALQRKSLEFSIPEFVRAADCVLATRRGRGKRDFIERALRVAPAVLNHWYVGGTQPDLEARIGQLYDHRSDCVHGKVPFHDLSSKGEAGIDEAARFEYLAEMIAREAICLVLRDPNKMSALTARDRLEAAWANGTFL